MPTFTHTEFRRHQKTDNPLHIIGFLSQWKLYLDELPADPSQEFKGRKLDPTIVEKVQWHSVIFLSVKLSEKAAHSDDAHAQMSAEQLGQLYELMHATKGVWKPVSTDDPTKKSADD